MFDSFAEYLFKIVSLVWLEPEERPEPLCNDPELDEYRLDQIDTLRFGIKKDRDKHFVETQYDDLGVDGVPKSFWLTDYEQDTGGEEMDEYSQSALGDFD